MAGREDGMREWRGGKTEGEQGQNGEEGTNGGLAVGKDARRTGTQWRGGSEWGNDREKGQNGEAEEGGTNWKTWRRGERGRGSEWASDKKEGTREDSDREGRTEGRTPRVNEGEKTGRERKK